MTRRPRARGGSAGWIRYRVRWRGDDASDEKCAEGGMSPNPLRYGRQSEGLQEAHAPV